MTHRTKTMSAGRRAWGESPGSLGAPPAMETGVATSETCRAAEGFSEASPRPELLAGGDRVQHGFDERIVAMAEKEQTHRHEMNAQALAPNALRERRRSTIAFVRGIAGWLSGGVRLGLGRGSTGRAVLDAGMARLVGTPIHRQGARSAHAEG